ncbi:15641_t:CDS:1 [Racocetra fulgida]|uniref:15641_t:CDS:1 n=1 Tax=Racocetra fulgida TaxID=60492 RepID=A0A9N9BMC3_9GLOM|nr:15641_t:CDS:1 [Racocetra fulgida]
MTVTNCIDRGDYYLQCLQEPHTYCNILDTPQAKNPASSTPSTLVEKTRGSFQTSLQNASFQNASFQNPSVPTNIDNHSTQITSIQQSTIFSQQTLSNTYLINQNQVAFNPLGLQQIIRPGQGVAQGVQPVNFVQPVQQPPYIMAATGTPQIFMRPTQIYALQHYQPINLQGVNAPQPTTMQPLPPGTRPIAIGNTSNSISTTDDNTSRAGRPNASINPINRVSGGAIRPSHQSIAPQITNRNPPTIQKDPQ